MFQYSRLHELLEYFILHRECSEVSKLCKIFQVSDRTLRSDIRNLNDDLQTYRAQVIMKRKKGYYLQVDDEKSRSLLENLIKENDDSLDSVERRINHLILKMLYANTYITQDDLADDVYVSTNTIVHYLKTIRTILDSYNLTLQTRNNWGYIITGDELNKRRCIINLITTNYHHYALTFSREQKELLHHVNLEKIKKLVLKFNRENNVHFSDYNLKNLILHIALSISRLYVSNSIENYDVPYNEAIECLLQPLIKLIEKEFKVQFQEEERKYIYSHYVANTNELLNAEKNAEYINNIVVNIIDIIYESYHFDLRSDMILKKDLCHHLQSILNTKYYNLNKKNPLLNTIKNNYILAFEISETALKQVFLNEPFDLTEDEIGYISLHIGAAIERYFDIRNTKHLNVAIVYDSGYATGSFISSKLHTIFKDSFKIINTYPSHEFMNIDYKGIDFVISTVSLNEEITIPVIVIDIPILQKDIDKIAKFIANDDIHPVDKISSFFDDDLFINTTVSSKEEIIHELCELLYKKNCVPHDFEASVLEREARVSTAMDGVVAIPHPLKICSNKSTIAVGILKHSISWSKKDNAQIILMLALADDSRKDIEKLYDTFVAMMHNPSLQKQLFKAKTLQDFLRILKENITDDL